MKNTNKLWPSILLVVLMAALLAVLVAVGLTAAAEETPDIVAEGIVLGGFSIKISPFKMVFFATK